MTKRAMVHITFRASMAESKDEACEKVILLGQMTNINQRRFSRYGILSGHVSEASIDTIRGLAFVKAVEVDGLKHSSKESNTPE